MANEAFEMSSAELATIISTSTEDEAIQRLADPQKACYECLREQSVPFPNDQSSTLCALHYAAVTEENRRIIMLGQTTRQASPFEAQTREEREEALRNLADAQSGIEKAQRFASRLTDADAPLAAAIWNSVARTQRYITAAMEELRETPVAHSAA